MRTCPSYSSARWAKSDCPLKANLLFAVSNRLPPVKFQLLYEGRSEVLEDLPVTGEGLAPRRAWPFAAFIGTSCRARCLSGGYHGDLQS
jgi:hypothetical protein